MSLCKLLFYVLLGLNFLITPVDSFAFQHHHSKKKMHLTHHKKKSGFSKHRYVGQNNYEKYWYKSTFPSNQASIQYHTQKHANGRTSLQYTRDAVNFYEKNKHLRQPFTLKDGSPGYKIKKGQAGGTWTKNGKIVTFWG